MKNSFLFLLICFVIVACQPSNQSTEDTTSAKPKPAAEKPLTPEEQERKKLRKEVMDVHDYTMAKMGMLHELEEKITAEVDSNNVQLLEQATQNIRSLRKADADMMDWMRQYKDPAKEVSLDSAKKYFMSQKTSMEKIKVDTDQSISDAEAFLKEIKK